jgi:hypothetical protein
VRCHSVLQYGMGLQFLLRFVRAGQGVSDRLAAKRALEISFTVLNDEWWNCRTTNHYYSLTSLELL